MFQYFFMLIWPNLFQNDLYSVCIIFSANGNVKSRIRLQEIPIKSYLSAAASASPTTCFILRKLETGETCLSRARHTVWSGQCS